MQKGKGSRRNLINQEKCTLIPLVFLDYDSADKPDVDTTVLPCRSGTGQDIADRAGLYQPEPNDA